MPALLTYGNAIELLSRLNEAFGRREINPNIMTIQKDVPIPLRFGRLKKGRLVTTPETVLAFDETDDEYQERLDKKLELEAQGAKTSHAFLKRDLVCTKKDKQTVNKLITAARSQVELYRHDTKGLFSQSDIAALVIELIKYGSEADERFFGDKPITAPNHFFYCSGYAGDDKINQLLSQFDLHQVKKIPLSQVLSEIRKHVPFKTEHQALLSKIESYNRRFSDRPINVLTSSEEEITKKLTKNDLLDHYYGAFLDTDEPTTTIDDFPCLSQDYLQKLQERVIQPLEAAKTADDRQQDSLFSRLFAK